MVVSATKARASNLCRSQAAITAHPAAAPPPWQVPALIGTIPASASLHKTRYPAGNTWAASSTGNVLRSPGDGKRETLCPIAAERLWRMPILPRPSIHTLRAFVSRHCRADSGVPHWHVREWRPAGSASGFPCRTAEAGLFRWLRCAWESTRLAIGGRPIPTTATEPSPCSTPPTQSCWRNPRRRHTAGGGSTG